MAGAEEISVSAIFLYAIKAPPPAPQSPTPDPSPVGRGVNTVVSCALLPNRSVTRNSVLRLIAERIRRRLWRPRRSLSYKLQQTWCCGGQKPPIYSSSGGYSKNAITSATYHSPPTGEGLGVGLLLYFTSRSSPLRATRALHRSVCIRMRLRVRRACEHRQRSCQRG